MFTPNATSTELRPVDQIIKILAEIEPLLDPQMLFKMMQPNVILAIAGIKPLADMCEIDPESTTLPNILKINGLLYKYGLNLYVIIKSGNTEYFGGIESSLGLERTTRLSKFSFVIKYNYTNNPSDFAEWKEAMKLKYQEEVAQGHFTDKEIGMIRQGLEMGYPDQAILDLVEYYKLEENIRINVPAYLRYIEEDRISESLKEKINGKEVYVKVRLHIPEEYLETSPLPLFSYNAKSKGDVDINNWTNEANNILDDFYCSEWYKTNRI